jgi:hypothetical protein
MRSSKNAQPLQIGEQRELAVFAGYYELRGILAPIGDAQRQRNASLLPPDLAAAYDQCMAG